MGSIRMNQVHNFTTLEIICSLNFNMAIIHKSYKTYEVIIKGWSLRNEGLGRASRKIREAIGINNFQVDISSVNHRQLKLLHIDLHQYTMWNSNSPKNYLTYSHKPLNLSMRA